MASKSGIAIAGSIIVDKLNEISSYPASGELTKILSLTKAVGGCVSNTSIDIKKIDASIPVKSLGKIGNDHDGDFLVETLLKNGVDVSLLTRGDNPTSFTDVMSVVGGQRTFFAFPGACDDFGYDDIDFEKDAKLISEMADDFNDCDTRILLKLPDVCNAKCKCHRICNKIQKDESLFENEK